MNTSKPLKIRRSWFPLAKIPAELFASDSPAPKDSVAPPQAAPGRLTAANKVTSAPRLEYDNAGVPPEQTQNEVPQSVNAAGFLRLLCSIPSLAGKCLGVMLVVWYGPQVYQTFDTNVLPFLQRAEQSFLAFVNHGASNKISGVWGTSTDLRGQKIQETTVEFQSNGSIEYTTEYKVAGQFFASIEVGTYEINGGDIVANLTCKSIDGNLFEGVAGNEKVGDRRTYRFSHEPNGDIVLQVQDGKPGIRLRPVTGN